MDSLKLNPVQKAAFSLIQQDLRYIYTVIKNINPKASNYIPSMLPYLGVVIDGAEDWLKAIKNSSKCKFCMPLFNESQTSVYKGYKQDKIEMRGDRAEISDFPLYLNTVAGGLDRRDQAIGGFSFVVKIYAVPVVEIIG